MFLNKNPDSFINYRLLSSYIDATILDIDSFQYESNIFINAFIYLLILSNISNIHENSMNNSWEEDSQKTVYEAKNENFDEIFNNFLKNKFNTNIDEIFTVICYAKKFSKLETNFELPSDNFDETTTFDFHVRNLEINEFNLNFIEKL